MQRNPTAIKDIYFCLSLQAKTLPPKKPGGDERAARHADDALALKAIWLDIDVKPDKPEKAYVSKSEVLSALHKFCTDAGLPPPTAGVFSGGGVHAYWISDRPLTVAEWQPYAEGLKALAHRARPQVRLRPDDRLRARPPRAGHIQLQDQPAAAVRLAWLLPTDYDFAAALGHIQGGGGAAEGCYRWR